MFSVKGDSTIAGVTELRQNLASILDRVDHGESVVLQKNNEPVGVLLGYPVYVELMRKISMIEDLALAVTALRREDRILKNQDELVALADVLREYGIDPEAGLDSDDEETI
jgi:prevent-host-death family protein